MECFKVIADSAAAKPSQMFRYIEHLLIIYRNLHRPPLNASDDDVDDKSTEAVGNGKTVHTGIISACVVCCNNRFIE